MILDNIHFLNGMHWSVTVQLIMLISLVFGKDGGVFKLGIRGGQELDFKAEKSERG